MTEIDECEAYNQKFNARLAKRPVTNLKRCEGIKKPPMIYWEKYVDEKFEYKFLKWKKNIVSRDISCDFPYWRGCKACKGTGYVHITT